MQLEAVTAVLRPRPPWEAVDLGFAMARRWLKPLYLAWFAVLIPLLVLLHGLCIQALWLVPWLLWWLKPLLDRVPLYVLSHTLFGEVPTVRQLYRALPGLLGRQALSALILGRLDPARSFHLPVRQLEGLRGRERRRRQRVLKAREKTAAAWLTITCLHLETALNFAIIGLIWLMLPQFVELDFIGLLTGASAAQQVGINLVSACGLSLIEPFYVAGGFALYLNRRTWLEAWDIELGFRRLGRRLAQAAGGAAAVSILVIGLGTADRAMAGTEAASEPAVSPACQRFSQELERLRTGDSAVQRTLAEVLQEQELRRCDLTHGLRFKGERDARRPRPLARNWQAVVASALEILLWAALLALAALLLNRLRRVNLPARRPRPAPGRPPAPIRQGLWAPPALPATGIGADAWALWVAGQQRAALGLLYRASLAALSARYGIAIAAAATEEECLRLVEAQLADPAPARFVGRIARAWQTVAYAHRPPLDDEIRRLCEQWPVHFPGESSEGRGAGGGWRA